jgi:putative phosphoribosyl transferase
LVAHDKFIDYSDAERTIQQGIKMLEHQALFTDRVAGGSALARALIDHLQDNPPDNALVLALPRGGVPVAYEVAIAMGLPLDIFIVRKLGVPNHAELAMGAIASGGVSVLNDDIIRALGISAKDLQRVESSEQIELKRREQLYRGSRAPVRVEGRTIILIDDGMATGATMRAAVKAVRRRSPLRIIVAAPVASLDAKAALESVADDCVFVATPEPFMGVGRWYQSFDQTDDDEVTSLLKRAWSRNLKESRHPPPHDPPQTKPITMETDSVVLHGDLALPRNAKGIVLFAHGSGSGRHSPRNQFVAQSLQKIGLATLLMDLLTKEEEQTDMVDAALRFNIGLLGQRLSGAVRWLQSMQATSHLRLGIFGASTGAAAALIAAVRDSATVSAVVSRGGRPDLAGASLPLVSAPTLLIVGGNDEAVVGLNKAAMARMKCPVELRVVPGATHLFQEPGALESVATLAGEWFTRYLA